MISKLKIGLGIASGAVASVIGVLSASAQTIPTWDASSTTAVVGAAADAFQDTFVYVLQVIAPFAIIVGLIVVAVWFFRGLGRRMGH